MKKIVYILISVLLFQSCMICNLTKEQVADCLDNPDECPYYDQIVLEIALGKSLILGGDSWKDPIGAQIVVETRFMEITDNAAIYTGLGISYQGANYVENEYSGTVRLSYIGAPVMVNYLSDCGLYGEIGLQPGFLLSARDKIEGGDSWGYRDHVRNFDLGLPVGAGYKLNDQLSLGLRATYGLINLDNTGSTVKDHNLMFTAVANYSLFGAKKK